jgi:hypothetical protein
MYWNRDKRPDGVGWSKDSNEIARQIVTANGSACQQRLAREFIKMFARRNKMAREYGEKRPSRTRHENSSNRGWRSLTTIGAITTLCAACASSNDSSSETPWTHLKRADFPASIEAIVFPNSLALSASESMRWGAWSVSFGDRPTAEIGQDDEKFRMIVVRHLKCSNAVEGEVNCSMLLTRDERGREPSCSLSLEYGKDHSPQADFLGIKCPSVLRLR